MSFKSLAKLEKIIDYKFEDHRLLEEALTHRSFAKKNNERLEFLGDAILNFTIAELLYAKFNDLKEGDLSRLRSNLVNQKSLYMIANKLQLGKFLRMGEGEIKSKGFQKPSILSDSLEAIFGAIFLDGGFNSIKDTIHRLYEPFIIDINIEGVTKDSKTTLQELLQAKRFKPPNYSVSEVKGHAHQQIFTVICKIPELDVMSSGEGTNRRSAEQDAARLALEIVEK